jgi:hypothetical protein
MRAMAVFRLGLSARVCAQCRGQRQRSAAVILAATGHMRTTSPDQIWGAIMDVSRRAQQAGAIYSIDTVAQSAVDKDTGVDVRVHAVCLCGRLLTDAPNTVRYACRDESEGQATAR